jgi:hypothetical protein
LVSALELDGEFLILTLSKEELKEELQTKKLHSQISQSLSIVVRFEDDTTQCKYIHDFVKHLHNYIDDTQNFIFGIKKVKKLSKNPVTILFSAILPINQLNMKIGVKIDQFIHSDDEFFPLRFKKFRDSISKEIGTTILPILPQVDNSLDDFEVKLIDP